MERLFISKSVFNSILSKKKKAFISRTTPISNIPPAGADISVACKEIQGKRIILHLSSVEKLSSVVELSNEQVYNAGYMSLSDCIASIGEETSVAYDVFYIPFDVCGSIDE